MIRKQSQFKKEKMTIDKLAQMTANGFSEMDKKFNEVDKRFDRVENSITDLRVEFNDLKSEVNQKIEYGIDRMLTIADQMTSQFLTWKQENAFTPSLKMAYYL